MEDQNIAGEDGVLSRYYGILQSVRGIVKAAVERTTSYTDKLTQLRLLFDVGRKVKAASLSTGTSQERSRVAESENALEAEELELRTLPGLVAENVMLRTKARWLGGFVETLGREGRKVVMLTQTVRDLVAISKRIQPVSEALRK